MTFFGYWRWMFLRAVCAVAGHRVCPICAVEVGNPDRISHCERCWFAIFVSSRPEFQ